MISTFVIISNRRAIIRHTFLFISIGASPSQWNTSRCSDIQNVSSKESMINPPYNIKALSASKYKQIDFALAIQDSWYPPEY